MWYNEIKFAYSGHNLYIFAGRGFAKQRNSKQKKRNKTQKTPATTIETPDNNNQTYNSVRC